MSKNVIRNSLKLLLLLVVTGMLASNNFRFEEALKQKDEQILAANAEIATLQQEQQSKDEQIVTLTKEIANQKEQLEDCQDSITEFSNELEESQKFQKEVAWYKDDEELRKSLEEKQIEADLYLLCGYLLGQNFLPNYNNTYDWRDWRKAKEVQTTPNLVVAEQQFPYRQLHDHKLSFYTESFVIEKEGENFIVWPITDEASWYIMDWNAPVELFQYYLTGVGF